MVSTKVKQVEQQGGLISYLARVFSMLQASPVAQPEHPQPEYAEMETPAKTMPKERVLEATHPARRIIEPAHKTVTVFLAEEQQILKEAYISFFQDQRAIEITGSTEDTSTESLVAAAKAYQPDAMLLGVKSVQKDTVRKLEDLRQACPKMALVLLFAFYDVQGIKALREFSKDTQTGCAYLMKHTVDTVEQLTQVIFSVVEGRIIIDPIVMEGLIKTGDGRTAFLRDLSPRELEVLSWMAKGYRNDTIAGVLSRDVKTVERHINNIYSKLLSDRNDEENEGSKHPRVQAALTYLKATGMLTSEGFAED